MGPNTAAGVKPAVGTKGGGGEGAGLLQSTLPPGPNCCCCCCPKAAATGPNCIWLAMLPKLKPWAGAALSNSWTASCMAQ